MSCDRALSKRELFELMDSITETFNYEFNKERQEHRSKISKIWKYYYLLENSNITKNKVPILSHIAKSIMFVLLKYGDKSL